MPNITQIENFVPNRKVIGVPLHNRICPDQICTQFLSAPYQMRHKHTQAPPASYFSTDLAMIHDEAFGDFARQACREVLATLQGHPVENPRLLDLGCGSGIFEEALVDSHFLLAGVDLSESMIERARKKVPSAAFWVDSFWECDFPQSDIVVSIGECINYELDQVNSYERLEALFSKVHRSLSEGGYFIFDMLIDKATDEDYNASAVRVHHHKDWSVILERTEEEGLITSRFTTYTAVGKDLYRKSEEVHLQRRYNLAAVLDILLKLGFQNLLKHGYANLRLPRGHVVIVATK